MPKIRKKLLKEYSKRKKLYVKNKKEIMSLFKDTIASKYDRNIWKITDVELCNDEFMKDTFTEYEWVEISDTKYYEIIKHYWNRNLDNYKEEYIFEPTFEIKYFKRQEKKYEYLRIWVHEAWGCSGHDDVYYDFLLTDILDEKDLRKEKLEKLMEL